MPAHTPAAIAMMFFSAPIHSTPTRSWLPYTRIVGPARSAPAFSMTLSSKDGTAAEPVTLASLKGKVVVLAFFPRARTSGCTIQMKAYRDRYAELFGNDVQLIAISTDTPEAQASWAKDEAFPFRFGADVNARVGKAYDVATAAGMMDSRVLFVIGKVVPLRVSARDEAAGVDVGEHGEEGYTDGEGAILVLESAVPALAPTATHPIATTPLARSA